MNFSTNISCHQQWGVICVYIYTGKPGLFQYCQSIEKVALNSLNDLDFPVYNLTENWWILDWLFNHMKLYNAIFLFSTKYLPFSICCSSMVNVGFSISKIFLIPPTPNELWIFFSIEAFSCNILKMPAIFWISSELKSELLCFLISLVQGVTFWVLILIALILKINLWNNKMIWDFWNVDVDRIRSDIQLKE